jgi:hypothetical protein
MGDVPSSKRVFPQGRVRILLYALAGILVALGIVAAILVSRFQPLARDYLISAIRQRYNSEVEMGDLQISFFPTVHATGKNLVLRFGGRRDLPPMIRVRQFTLDAQFVNFFRNPRRISRLRLDGLEIQTPPRSAGGVRPHAQGASDASASKFILDEVIADSALLSTMPSDPTKDPLIFQLRELTMRSVGVGSPMTFHVKLENAKPPGLIHSDGRFGPWNSQEPSDTPVSGNYTFRDADLGVFKGIAGTLSSDGKYQGQLGKLEVQGTTDTPNFALDLANHAMALHTEFNATVDGTNGNTVLHPVRARLGNSSFEVSGSVARGALEEHKEIDLDARTSSARLDDFLRLTVMSPKPPMTGGIGFITKVKIPPGRGSVADRMELAGTFTLRGVKFTSEDVQEKIAGLSHHAQGDPKNQDENVTADFSGAFHLRDGQLSLPGVMFSLPGAHVTLSGGYGLRSGALNFEGTAKLDATVSQMTTGIKRLLLKPVDPLFRRDGAGTVLPIKISGTRGQPSFSLDIGRVLKRK